MKRSKNSQEPQTLIFIEKPTPIRFSIIVRNTSQLAAFSEPLRNQTPFGPRWDEQTRQKWGQNRRSGPEGNRLTGVQQWSLWGILILIPFETLALGMG
jgi:hypothetical protein